MNNILSRKGSHYPSSQPIVLLSRFRKARFLATITGISMIYQMVFPNVCLALTSGPSSPDFASFEPVATTNMVNEFTGQFVYNLPVIEIPGANGAGYALSLSYHSGDGPESESSWVGSGWTLNPGTINRSKRGFPDDFDRDSITYYNTVPTNWTVAATGNFGTEVFSGAVSVLGASGYTTVRYNNYKGFGFTQGFGLNAFDGLLSLGMSITDGQATYSAAVNPGAILSLASNAAKANNTDAGSTSAKQSNKFVSQSMKRSVQSFVSGGLNAASSRYISYLLTDMTSPYNLTPYDGYDISGNVALTEDLGPAPMGLSEGANVSYSSQKNISPRGAHVYGYMYTGNDTEDNTASNKESMMDYTIENPSTFNQRDKYLPIPFSTPDAYFISGEGLSGSFRMYNDRIGIFSPNYTESNTTINFFGLDFHLGLDDGVGGEAVVDGSSTLKVKSSWTGNKNGNTNNFWFVPYNFVDSTQTVEEGSFFRFNNDLGGKLIYDNTANSDQPAYVPISGGSPTLDESYKLLQRGYNINKAPTSGTARRNGRSSFIGFHTVREINTRSTVGSSSVRVLAAEKTEYINTLAGRNDPSDTSTLANQIGEIYTVNEAGNQYVYGLPIYTAGETNMQHGLSLGSTGDNYIVNSDISTNSVQVGEQYHQAYATNYLLTQITTPDYVDINQNGPDDADLGGYTRFCYNRATPNGTDYNKNDYTSSNWYQWRMPYEGMYYRPNRLSDKTDDMGSYQYGYKESYYLDSIITKTHYAVFVTDTTSDGIQAADINSAALGNVGSGNGHRKLIKILLYAKNTHGGADQLLKTVHFDYTYQCWPGSPNSLAGAKLTLKRVWFEYNGAANATISPYIFDYQYPNVQYPSQYAYINTEMMAYGAAETPNYSQGKYIDCWGNYQYDGLNRRNSFMSWPSQNPGSFDPAAWQLKRITLPSGGEIHIQYEQNTYSYVQDRPASALVRLTNNSITDNTYILDVGTDLGVSSSADKQALVAYINKNCTNKKIYFKFYYALMGTSAAAIGSCRGDYIEGYADFFNAIYEPSDNSVRIKLSGSSLPQNLCYDYVQHQVGGDLRDDACNTTAAVSTKDPGAGGKPSTDVLSDLGKQLLNAAKAAINVKANNCKTFNANYSFFRIPILKKKGGGIRVKRLLMYDKGVDANNPSLYGTEYIYDNQSNNMSYGVATNEPSENKGENPLVTYLEKRTSQSWIDGMIAGKDKEQFEGPIGMNALPGASIGYSRIIKKNIAQSKDVGTGFTVADYYTVKDYPYDRYYPELNSFGVGYSPINTTKDAWSVDIGLFSYNINTGLRSSQGYCFIQNQMHGQLKSISSYPGKYDPNTFYSTNFPPVPVSQQTYTYFEPGEQVPMYDFDNWKIQYEQPGKEMDVTIDKRSVSENASETRFTGDITVGTAGIVEIPYTIGFPITSSSSQSINTIVVNKVIHYPAIVKQITVMKDGYVQTTENVAFDPQTTRPVITRTYDGFDGLYLKDKPNKKHNGAYWSYNIPASSQYSQMGQRAWNELYYYSTKSNLAITVDNPIGSPSTWVLENVNPKGMFSVGDLLALYKKSGAGGGVNMVNVTATSGNNITVCMAASLDAGALIPTSTNSNVYYKAEVIHSNYNNNLSASAGGFLQYGDSVTLHAEVYADSLTVPAIVKANLTTYSDNTNWPYTRATYGVPTNYNVYEAGIAGKFRPWASYTYLDTVSRGSQPDLGQRIYNAGVTRFTIYGLWKNIFSTVAPKFPNPGSWILTSQVNNYSADGAAVQESDIDTVYSTAKYGYRGTLPYLIAQNTQFNSVRFESFENTYGSPATQLEDGMTISSSAHVVPSGHTGKYCYDLLTTDAINIPATYDYLGKGLVLRFWSKYNGTLSNAANISIIPTVDGVLGTAVHPNYVARSGQWVLYEYKWSKTPAAAHSVSFKITSTAEAWFDDIRVQMPETKSMAYVYDVGSYKVSAEMDDQDFATIYQYNGEGKLVRKIAETLEGMKTIEETEYHTPMTLK